MLQLYKLEKDVSIPVRLLFEHQESDAYHPVEQSGSAADGVHSVPPAAEPANEASEQPETALPGSSTNTVTGPVEAARLTRIQFRQALIEVDDPADFWKGVVGGQVAAVETEAPLTGARIFAAFEDAVSDLAFSETWLAGYLLGLSDAWLRDRKLYPPIYTAAVKALKKKRKR